MLLIRQRAYARAGLVGNPSDGYYGKTISVIVRNFWAEVSLYEWDQLELVLSQEDRSRFRSVQDLVRDVELHGYYGGIRLVKATIKRFAEFCAAQRLPLDGRNFSVRYESNIPRQVGLAGSSAIIVALLRCLMDFYRIEIPERVLPSLALSVETQELALAAGLQDRVIQVYEGLVYMDFARDRVERICGLECGVYERLDPALLPPLYVAYNTDVSKPVQMIHNHLKERFQRGDQAVVSTMAGLAELTVDARRAILARDARHLGSCINKNFDFRQSICHLAPPHVEMVEAARRAGATASFAGSGGAIVGTCPDQATFRRLQAALEPIHCRVLRPQILPGDNASHS